MKFKILHRTSNTSTLLYGITKLNMYYKSKLLSTLYINFLPFRHLVYSNMSEYAY